MLTTFISFLNFLFSKVQFLADRVTSILRGCLKQSVELLSNQSTLPKNGKNSGSFKTKQPTQELVARYRRRTFEVTHTVYSTSIPVKQF